MVAGGPAWDDVAEFVGGRDEVEEEESEVPEHDEEVEEGADDLIEDAHDIVSQLLMLYEFLITFS